MLERIERWVFWNLLTKYSEDSPRTLYADEGGRVFWLPDSGPARQRALSRARGKIRIANDEPFFRLLGLRFREVFEDE